MFELLKDHFDIARPLLPTGYGFPEPKAVIAGTNPGWVFVDDMTSPRAAMVWSKGVEGMFLLGECTADMADEINRVVDEVMTPRLASQGIDYFDVSTVTPGEDEALKAIFRRRKLDGWRQLVHLYTKSEAPKQRAIDSGILTNIRDLRSAPDMLNQEFISTKLLNNWDSLDAFLSQADGYCVLADGRVVSMAYTGWIADDVHEISIETLEPYRFRGYAEACAAALVAEYLKKGYTPLWECEAANTASATLVMKLGFERIFEYDCYGFPLK